ncbi:9322_t:CDS:2, partial [Gigaspora rosea]
MTCGISFVLRRFAAFYGRLVCPLVFANELFCGISFVLRHFAEFSPVVFFLVLWHFTGELSCGISFVLRHFASELFLLVCGISSGLLAFACELSCGISFVLWRFAGKLSL